MNCDIPLFYTERFVKAKKEYVCCETGKIIKKGERYWRMSGKWDGVFQTFIQSEAAYHFARHMNGVKDGGNMTGYDPEQCIPFGRINESPFSESEKEEWERVKKGEVTRCTVKQ